MGTRYFKDSIDATQVLQNGEQVADKTTVDSIQNQLNGESVSDNTLTVLPYDKIAVISLSANRTFTLAAAPTGCLPEYQATITNSSANAVDMTFTGISVILTNDDEEIVVNGNVMTVSAGVSVDCSIQNGKMIAIVF